MAIKPRPQMTIEDMLRGLAKEERAGLLGVAVPSGSAGLIDVSGANIGRSSTPDPMQGPQNESTGPYSNSVQPKGGLLPRLNGDPGTAPSAPAMKGLLPTQRRPGLLDPNPPQPAPRSRVAQAGNFLDDFLFGGAAGERSAERRARQQQEAAQAAHRDAFAFASTEQGFDPNRYGARMAELGQAPGMADIVNLEGVNDGRDVRGERQRTERRKVQGGALAPVLGLPADQQVAGYAEANRYLEGEGFGMDPNMSNPAMASAVAVGSAIGGDSFLDNQRGDRTLVENQRQAQAAETYRNRDLEFRQGESEWERQYRLSRAAADDNYRAQELDYRRDALTIPNSTGDVLAPILNKVATMGEGALNPGEAAIWKRYQDSGQAAGMWGAPPALPGVTAPPAQPQAQAPRAPQGDPFPGIAEGQIIDQGDKSYQRRGNQMVEVR